MSSAYPLEWPPGWPRTNPGKRQRSQFGGGWNKGVTTARGIQDVLEELRRLKAKSVVISTNVELRLDGLPYSNRRDPDDPGVAAYFTLDGNEQCIPCDKWDRVGDNLRAISKTINALRGIERWGAKEMVDAAFRGFKALPPPSGDAIIIGEVQEAWHDVLGVSPDAPKSVIKASFKAWARSAHPDSGGSDTEFLRLKKAYDEGMKR